jgi:hypothetical protein
MTTLPSPPADANPSDDLVAGGDEDWARAMLCQDLQVLSELTDIGMGLARGLRRQAEGAADAGVVTQGDISLAYGRVSRAVRLTVALRARLIGELRNLERSLAHGGTWDGQTARTARTERVERIVQRIAAADGDGDADGVERVSEACERLEDDDLYDDVMTQPVSVLVARICEALGLAPDWPRLAGEPWARAELASGAVGPPLADLGSASSLDLALGPALDLASDAVQARAGPAEPEGPADIDLPERGEGLERIEPGGPSRRPLPRHGIPGSVWLA